ncbi:200 kDa antigen p200 [Trypanosoma theileri]|uniref:200 kDa antigen p200 n=1 Tax=Trypanosoma theileri TaxID=67003 RepID=A0A1X0NIP5_9TRYP|nr:200 kDa antigen p200 [Trypanosoma theileri]ORC84461.1 200 kDa antigen p200 [Trypanosoma theileri]
MNDRGASGWGSAPLNYVDEGPNSYFNRRDVSRGSASSFHEPRDSQTSARFSGRLSCRSSVRDETQTLDEFLRKQRVVRYMQEERERGARSKLEREEHDAWVNFRALERADRIKHLTEEEMLELLQREANEVERERMAAEEAARRVAEKTQERRRASAERKAPEQTPMPAEAQPPARTELDSLTRMTHEFRRREEDLRAALRRAQDDAASARLERDDAERAQRNAEAALQRETGRADEEATARKKTERRAEVLEARMEELQKKVANLEEMLRQAKSEEEKSRTAVNEKEKLLKSLREKLKAAQQENKDMDTKYKELQRENSTLSKNAAEVSKNKALAKQQAANLAALESERQLRTKAEQDVSELKQQLQSAEAERKRLAGVLEEQRSMQNRMEQQGKELNQAKVEAERLRERLQNESSARKRFEELAAQSNQGKNNGYTHEELERAKKEAKQYKEELEKTRQELDAMRESSNREIASLKAWCNRLEAQCDRQMIELREQMSAEDKYSPRTGNKEEKKDGNANSKVVVEKYPPGSLPSVTKLQSELDEVKSKLKESQEKEQRAIALAESLKKQNGGTVGGENKKDFALDSKVDELSKNNKELREAVAAAKATQQQIEVEKVRFRDELETERKKVISLEREKELLVEKLHHYETVKLTQEKVTELKDGTGAQSAGINIVSGDGQGLNEQITALQEELEKERKARNDAEKEAAALKSFADKETEARKKAEAALNEKSKAKTKSGCC